VALARRREKSTNLFLQAGRAEIRDLLEAQESLISAEDTLTSVTINYRLAELELQKDLGLLQVNEEGLWIEATPEDVGNDR
jgi:outer membrane protein TolC